MPAPLLVAKNSKTELYLLPALANRHGLITGATGTGKTVTLQSMAQQLSSIGVPVFMADVKGDLAGLGRAGGSVYFVTQNPLDIPETVLGQLGNRVQHALRAFTPKDQKAVKSAAETLRPNPKLKAEQVITELEVGEALVSFLDDKGRPNVVERAFVSPPGSRLGPLTDAERKSVIDASPVAGRYEKRIDRESAYEKLKGRTVAKTQDQSPPEPRIPTGTAPSDDGPGVGGAVSDILFGRTGPRGGQHDGLVQTMAKSVARTMGSQVGREIIRGVLGSILGKRR
jgi:hypothetical protein